LIRFGEEEIIPKPENDEVVVFKSFFKAGLRLSRLSKAKGWSRSPKPSAEYMNFTIRRRLEKTDCMRTSVAIILLIAKT
jgi:hypothetical protein